LEQAAAGTGVQMLIITESAAVERMLELVVAGNSAQLDDEAFVQELKSWIRFNAGDALRTRDASCAVHDERIAH